MNALNPIMQMLNRSNAPNLLSVMSLVRDMSSGKSPEEAYKQLMQSDPRFNDFVNKVQNMSLEEVCREYKLDLNQVKSLIG